MSKTLTDFDPATRDDVMRYLARGIVEDNLPTPDAIHMLASRAGVCVQDKTDAYTWIAWLGCGAPASDEKELGDDIIRTTWSEVAWRGWTIRVVLTTRTAVTR